MSVSDQSCLAVNFEELVKKTLTEWRYSSSTERLSLVYFFRCFYDLVERDFYLRSLLIIDARKYLEDMDNEDKSMLNFCKIILWHYQRVMSNRPIMFTAVRGRSLEVENKILSQIKYIEFSLHQENLFGSMLPTECLKVLQQFPNYRQLAKRNPLMRSLLMRHASYSTSLGDTDLRQFSVELLQEFKLHDMWLSPNLMLAELRSLKTEDLLMDIACNEYHLKLISGCRFTVFRVMRCFSDIFPNLGELNSILSLQLREDKCDKYLEKNYYNKKRMIFCTF